MNRVRAGANWPRTGRTHAELEVRLLEAQVNELRKIGHPKLAEAIEYLNSARERAEAQKTSMAP